MSRNKVRKNPTNVHMRIKVYITLHRTLGSYLVFCYIVNYPHVFKGEYTYIFRSVLNTSAIDNSHEIIYFFLVQRTERGIYDSVKF